MAARESREYEDMAAPLLLEALELDPELVLEPPMVVGSEVADTQVSFPWTTLPLREVKPEQSIS